MTDKEVVLLEWQKFLMLENHVLKQFPALLFQQAANLPDSAPPAKAAWAPAPQ